MAYRPANPHDALQRLIEGNARFLAGNPRLDIYCNEKFSELAQAQRPYATILGCSDSRVPPEIIFDADVGDLFVIRVAGNVVSPEVLGSIQYAALHLETPLFMVLGHQRCGAVAAALDAIHHGHRQASRIQALLDGMIPGLEAIEPGLDLDTELQRGVEANVRWSMRRLLETPEAKMRATEGKMQLVGAVYEIATGRVRLLPDGSGH